MVVENLNFIIQKKSMVGLIKWDFKGFALEFKDETCYYLWIELKEFLLNANVSIEVKRTDE